MMLPGAGGTARWTMNETGWGDKADAEGFLAVCPEGTPADPTRPASFRNNPLLWYPGSEDQDPRTARDIRFIDQLIDKIVTQFGGDPRRLFLTGFSNGAAMTFRLGTDLSGRFAALAPVAGDCRPRDPRPARPLPTVFLVGTVDPLIPLEGGEVVAPWGWRLHKPPVRETVQRWARALGCPPEPATVRREAGFTFSVYGPGRGNAELQVYQIDGLGHHWPGGKGRLDPELAGPPCDTVNATDVIWKFFGQWSG
jgi:polyhydroxybutyrate depolymerase